MLKSKTRWMIQKTKQEQIDMLAETIQVTPLVASLLVNRGLVEPEEAKAFLFIEKQEFHDPYLSMGWSALFIVFAVPLKMRNLF